MEIEPRTPTIQHILNLRGARWQYQRAWLRRFVVYKPLGAVGAGVVFLMLFLSIFGSFVTPYNPIDMDFTARLESPNLKPPLGTDLLGETC